MKHIFFALALVISTQIQAQTESCERLMAFDTTIVQNNVAARYSVLQLVNQQNYESIKQSGTINVPGYFDGSYDEFRKKRSSLESMFAASGGFSLEQGFYKHALSPAGAQAYAECVARSGNKPISAWIANKDSDGFLAITIKSGLSGNSTVVYTVTGTSSPVNEPTPLSAGSSQTLLFKRDPNKNFLVVINAKNQATQAADSTFVELPRFRNYEVVKEDRIDEQNVMCGAGCQGNTAGCQINEPAKFVAGSGFSYDPNSLRPTKQTVRFGPGSKHLSVSWVEGRDSDGSLQSISAQNIRCEGNSSHTNGATDYKFEARASRQYVREVPVK